MTPKKFLTNIDLMANQLLNVVIERLATDPASPATGQIWFNTTQSELKGYDGVAVKKLFKVDVADVVGFSDAVLAKTLNQFAAATGNVSLNGYKITNLLNPTSEQDAATKGYVDMALQGLDAKLSVRAATVANLAALTGTPQVDGVTLVEGDRILVKDQTDKTANGIYDVKAGAWTRSSDADNTPANEVSGGMYTFVEAGTQNGGNGFVLTSLEGPATLGTTELNFTQFSGAGQITAGAGLSKTGNQMDVNVDGTTLEINSDSLRVKASGIDTNELKNDGVTKDKINSDVAGAALGQDTDGSLKVNVDDTTIEINSDAIRIKAAGVDTNELKDDSVTRDKLNANTAGNGMEQDANGALAVKAADTSIDVSASGIKVTAAGFRTNNKYSANVGNGLLTDITVTHSLNTKDVIIQVYNNASPYDTVEVYTDRPTVDTISLSFAEAPTTGQYRVVIIG